MWSEAIFWHLPDFHPWEIVWLPSKFLLEFFFSSEFQKKNENLQRINFWTDLNLFLDICLQERNWGELPLEIAKSIKHILNASEVLIRKEESGICQMFHFLTMQIIFVWIHSCTWSNEDCNVESYVQDSYLFGINWGPVSVETCKQHSLWELEIILVFTATWRSCHQIWVDWKWTFKKAMSCICCLSPVLALLFLKGVVLQVSVGNTSAASKSLWPHKMMQNSEYIINLTNGEECVANTAHLKAAHCLCPHRSIQSAGMAKKSVSLASCAIVESLILAKLHVSVLTSFITKISEALTKPYYGLIEIKLISDIMLNNYTAQKILKFKYIFQDLIYFIFNWSV